MAGRPTWFVGYQAAIPPGSSYTFPTSGLCVNFQFAEATGTNNTVEPTNNFSITAGRGTVVTYGVGLISTSATGQAGTYGETALVHAPEGPDTITIAAWVKWLSIADRDTLAYGNQCVIRQSGTGGNLMWYLYYSVV